MKKLFSTLLFLLTASMAVSAQKVAALVITHADGTTTSYELFTKPRVTFVGDSVKIVSPTLSAEYPSADVLRFHYQLPSTAVSDVSTDERLSSDGEYLIFGGDVKSDAIKLYTVNGMAVPARFTSSASGVRLRLSSLLSGVYL